MDGKINYDDLKGVFDALNKSKEERKGYILLPTFDGFNLYEVDEARLKVYLMAENANKKHDELNTFENLLPTHIK